MRRYILYLATVALFLGVSLYLLVARAGDSYGALTWGLDSMRDSLPRFLRPSRPPRPPITVDLGVYDYANGFSESGIFAIDHEFFSWSDFDEQDIRDFLSQASERNRWVMLTIEPFPSGVLTRDALFDDVTSGKYDSAIERIALLIDASPNPVFVRWGHEMENVTGRYPWAKMDALGYQRAYRHFVAKCRATTQNAYFVWSPVGHRELGRYWPGSSVVDVVGVSVYGFPEFDQKMHGRVRTFSEIFSEKYERVAKFDKAVFIAEFGVTGDRDYQRRWIEDALYSTSKFPLLRSIVYFNAPDSKDAWGAEFSVPDWEVDAEAFEFFQ